LIAEQRPPPLKVGGYVRFDPADITVWLERSRLTGPSRALLPQSLYHEGLRR
jgi:hypothetical protein